MYWYNYNRRLISDFLKYREVKMGGGDDIGFFSQEPIKFHKMRGGGDIELTCKRQFSFIQPIFWKLVLEYIHG